MGRIGGWGGEDRGWDGEDGGGVGRMGMGWEDRGWDGEDRGMGRIGLLCGFITMIGKPLEVYCVVGTVMSRESN